MEADRTSKWHRRQISIKGRFHIAWVQTLESAQATPVDSFWIWMGKLCNDLPIDSDDRLGLSPNGVKFGKCFFYFHGPVQLIFGSKLSETDGFKHIWQGFLCVLTFFLWVGLPVTATDIPHKNWFVSSQSQEINRRRLAVELGVLAGMVDGNVCANGLAIAIVVFRAWFHTPKWTKKMCPIYKWLPILLLMIHGNSPLMVWQTESEAVW